MVSFSSMMRDARDLVKLRNGLVLSLLLTRTSMKTRKSDDCGNPGETLIWMEIPEFFAHLLQRNGMEIPEFVAPLLQRNGEQPPMATEYSSIFV